MENSYILAILFTFSCLSGEADGIPCSKGEKLHTPREGHDVCIMCDPGTFMDEESHLSRTCKPCTKIENSEVEVLVSSACNRTRDTEILCTSGFYRRKARNGRQKDRCEKCTECEFPARNCEGYNDTLCCPPDHDAVMSSSGVFVCEERPVVCGPGQFLNSRTEECTPCPDRTFMSAHNHRYPGCFKCQELSGNNDNHAVIIRPCNRTAPTLFGCEKDYFRDPRQESTQIEVPCTPCGKCGRRNSHLAECSMFQGCQGEKVKGEKMQGEDDDDDDDDDEEEEDTQGEKEQVAKAKSGIGQVTDVTTKTSVPQSESSARKYSKDCLFEIGKADEVNAWLQAALCIVISVIFGSAIFCLPKNLATCNIGNIYLHRRQFTCMLIILNGFNSVLFILKACLETKIIGIEGYFLYIITAVSLTIFMVNPALLLFFVRNARPKIPRKRNGKKDAETPHNVDAAESQLFVGPTEKKKEASVIRKLQKGDTSDDDTSC